MNATQILLSLLARWRVVLFVLAGSLAIGLLAIEQMPVRYTAGASLLVDTRTGMDPLSALLAAGNRATQEDIIKSDRVALKVVKALGLDKDAGLQREWAKATEGKGSADIWLAGLITRGLTVAPARRDSTILTIEYTAEDPVFAASAANAFAQAYLDATIELRIEPTRQNARWVAEQSSAMRETLEKAQARLSQYQQQRGIAVSGEDKVDLETSRLVELNAQLTTLQSLMSEVRSKRRSGNDALPEVSQNSAIQGLRVEIAKQEARIKVAAGNLGRNHPDFLAMEMELAELRARLDAETRLVTSGFSASSAAGSDREKDLRQAIEVQKKKVIELRGERDRVAVMQRDVDAAKSAYDAVARRYNMTVLESQANQTNVSLLAAATPPLEPVRKTDRFILMAVVASILLSLLAGLAVEVFDRRVRTVEDVEKMLGLPVLAVVQHRRAQRRLRQVRAAALPAPK